LPIGEFFRDALIQALSCAYEPRWVAARRYPLVTAAVVAAAAGLGDAAWGQDGGLASAADNSVMLLFLFGAAMSLPSPADADLDVLPRWRAWADRFPRRYAVLVAAAGAVAQTVLGLALGRTAGEIVGDAAITSTAVLILLVTANLWERARR
jgi:hypothetical protein